MLIVCFSPLIEWLAETFALEGTFLILAGCLLHTIPCGLIFRPIDNKFIEEQDTCTTECLLAKDKYLDIKTFPNGTMQTCAKLINEHSEMLGKDLPSKLLTDGSTDTDHNESIKFEVKVVNSNNAASLLPVGKSLYPPKEAGAVARHMLLLKNITVTAFLISQTFFFSMSLVPYVYLPDKAKQQGLYSLTP